MWNYEGLYVEGKYLESFNVSGKVRTSRVAYGGRVEHMIVLDAPIEVYGAVRDVVIIDHTEVAKVYSNK